MYKSARKPHSAASEQFLKAKIELVKFKKEELARAQPKPKPVAKEKKKTFNEKMKKMKEDLTKPKPKEKKKTFKEKMKTMKDEMKNFSYQKWLKKTKKDWKSKKKKKKSNFSINNSLELLCCSNSWFYLFVCLFFQNFKLILSNSIWFKLFSNFIVSQSTN